MVYESTKDMNKSQNIWGKKHSIEMVAMSFLSFSLTSRLALRVVASH
jgi:hypothetical protein